MKQLSVLCRNYVTSLKLKQLRASKAAGVKDHVLLNAILASLTRLREFSLCFKQVKVSNFVGLLAFFVAILYLYTFPMRISIHGKFGNNVDNKIFFIIS